MTTQTLYAIRNNMTGRILTGSNGRIATWTDAGMASLRAREYGLGFGSFALEVEPEPAIGAREEAIATVVTVADEHADIGAIASLSRIGVRQCEACKSYCAPANNMEQHPELGLACYVCRDTHDTSAKLLAMLSAAPSCQLSRPTVARKLGRRATSIDRAIIHLQRDRLIERAYKNPNLEKPSATTYKLTDAGSRAHFANIERKEHSNHVSP